MDIMPGLKSYSWPKRDEEAILSSLTFQAGRRVKGLVPSLEEQSVLLEKVVAAYPASKSPSWVAGGAIDWQLLRQEIVHVVNEQVKLDSSPGVPLSRFGKNKQVLESDALLVVEAVMGRVALLSGFELPDTPFGYVEGGFSDPVRLFVKNEPHPTRKTINSRYRLIMSVALVDQIIERLLFKEQNKCEIANFIDYPSMPGMGLTQSDASRVWNKVSALSGGDLSSAAEGDVSGFDWSVQEWELRLDGEIRIALMGVEEDGIVARMVRNRVSAVVNCVLASSQGKLFTVNVRGLQLSGSYNTSSTNSRIRYFMALRVGASWAITMGDDCLEEYREGALELYKLHGHPLREYNKCTSTFNFCSQIFEDPGTSYPADGTKTLYRLLCQEQDDEFVMKLEQFVREMKYSPHFGHYMFVIAETIPMAKAHITPPQAS